MDHKIKKFIPIKRLDEEVKAPGTVQADTVAHCGNSLSGEFINTVTVTDIFTGLTENQATWTKHLSKMKPAIKKREEAFPFDFKNFDTDCGGEFSTIPLWDFLKKVELVKRRSQ